MTPHQERGRSTAALGGMVSRTIAGLLITPLVVAIGGALTGEPVSQSLEDRVLELLAIAYAWYSGALLFTVVFGLPMYLVLNRLNMVRWCVALGAGLLVGGIGAVAFNGQSYWFSARLVVLGGIAGIVFWSFVRAKEPRKATW